MGGQAVILRLFPPDERVDPDYPDGFFIAILRHFFYSVAGLLEMTL